MSIQTTRDQTWSGAARGEGKPVRGLLLLFSVDGPRLAPIPLTGTLEIGRGRIGGVEVDDPCMSRRHASVSFDGKGWHLADLGSRNGSAVDGVALHGEVTSGDARVLRVGDSLLLLCDDLRPYLAPRVETRDGVVLGAALRGVWDQIARAAQGGDVLHITGESGTGKELAARAFHASGASGTGAFVAVNCAAIPPSLAERLLFGARRGAYSGADADADGYVQAADGGTLFLDEIAELDASVQAKLLRVLEAREVMAVGATRARKVQVKLCSATLRDLKREAGAGRFREDLYFRIATPRVELPPLRKRLDEIPSLVQREVARAEPLRTHVSLVEACLVRPWPGNVRELIAEVREAVREAVGERAKRVKASHLRDGAGMGFDREAPPPPLRAHRPRPDREAIARALRESQGNITRAAQALGIHRTQLRRWMAKGGIAEPTGQH